jgi:hypothetical protein
VGISCSIDCMLTDHHHQPPSLIPGASSMISLPSHAVLQYFRVGKLPLYSASDVYTPDTRLRMGVGVKALSATDDILLTLSTKKKLALQKQQDVVRSRVVLRSYTQLALAAHYDYNLKTEKVCEGKRGGGKGKPARPLICTLASCNLNRHPNHPCSLAARRLPLLATPFSASLKTRTCASQQA